MSQQPNQGMQKEVSPAALIGIGVAVVVVLIFMGYRFLAPHPAQVTIPPPEMQSERAAKMRNIEKAKEAGQASGTATGPAVDRTGG